KSNRQFVINKLKAIPIIPVRRHTNFYGYLKQNKKIPGERYHQRSQVESIFSAVKRKYGSVLRNKTFATQKVELISKLIAYNLDRKQLIFNYFFKGCTRAVGTKYL
ncbi:MAG: transposase, partial [Nanoarchaeota archaeon]|nr:transposase [Nanoarchaeota archaeon]